MTEVRWNADDCARHSGVQAGRAEELIGKLALTGAERLAALLGLRGDEHVLDVARDNGHAGFTMARLPPRSRASTA